MLAAWEKNFSLEIDMINVLLVARNVLHMKSTGLGNFFDQIE
jgi:hypothetical protein